MDADTPLQRALAEIRAFWSEAPLASIELSQEMVEYLATAVPLDDVILWTDGGLGRREPG
jgi:hypothetical protein